MGSIMSELYEAVIDLMLAEFAIDTDSLLGSSCELHLERSSLTRHVLGIDGGAAALQP